MQQENMGTARELTVEQLEKLLDEKKSGQIAFKDINIKGSAKATIDNFKMVLQHYSITIKYNEMSKDYEIEIPNKYFHKDIQDNVKMAEIRSLCHYQGFPVQEIDNYIVTIGNENSYHPVRDFINSGPAWDGVDRLPLYYDTFELATENKMKELILRKWVLSLVGALYYDNFSCEGVLTLYGEQGIGKTISVENIVPREYHNIWNKDGVVIDTQNKDTQIKALKYWITELGEVDATFKKSDIEALKGFITEKVDVLRLPYERKPNTYQRRTVFYATVNEEEFLRDSQNRRFWILHVKKVNHIDLDIHQFWKQIKHMYDQIKDKINSAYDREVNKEWGWFMSPEERKLMEPMQEQFKVIDSTEELLENTLTTIPKIETSETEWMNCTEILHHCGLRFPNRQQTNIASRWLKSHKFQRNWKKQWLVDIPKVSLITDNPYQHQDNGLDFRLVQKKYGKKD
jgi:putative DNA primase/helicase